ncbi:MAG: hypothetical protein QXH97_00235 [Candidatus Bathyarchaeia archaeon]
MPFRFLFTTPEKAFETIRQAKLVYENKTGIDGASQQYKLLIALGNLPLFNFKLSLEFRFILDFTLILNFDFDFDINFYLDIPFPTKAYYGSALYDVDVYDPPHPEATPPLRVGPHVWAENSIWRLSKLYSQHTTYMYNHDLTYARKQAKAYSRYFSRGLSPQIPEAIPDYAVRLAEAVYIAACWFDLNSFDLGRYSPIKTPLRFPKDDPLSITESDKPFYNYDTFDIAKFDEYLHPDRIIWVDADRPFLTRFDLAIFDYSKADLALRPPGMALKNAVENYRLRSDPLVTGTLWILASDRMWSNWVMHGVQQHDDSLRVKELVLRAGEPPILVWAYIAFAKELKYNSITLKHAVKEEIISKYKTLGLNESLLRRISDVILVR